MVIDLGNAWAAIGAILALASALAGIWWRLQVQITDAQRRIDRKACRRELSQLEVRIAESYVKRDELQATETRLLQELEALRQDVRGLMKKLDDFIMRHNHD